ncbi:MAG: hypothetical protein JXD18_06500 [Anaerolineae bacterium]|nr:hypothetical protein [Anaerolineae bacterium]
MSSADNGQQVGGLTSRRSEALQRVLTALRRDTIAQCVLLVDQEGSLIAGAGGGQDRLLGGVLPILAGEIAVVSRLGQKWDEAAVISLHHYGGGDYEIYAASAADTPYLLVVVTGERPSAYSSVIWLFIRRTMQELRWILRNTDHAASGVDGAQIGGLTATQARALGLLAEETITETVTSKEET